MRAYTACELQQIIDEVWSRAFEMAPTIHHQAPVPHPPSVQEIIDHPYTSSNAEGQYKIPWICDPRGRRGMINSITSLEMRRTKWNAPS